MKNWTGWYCSEVAWICNADTGAVCDSEFSDYSSGAAFSFLSFEENSVKAAEHRNIKGSSTDFFQNT